MSLRRYAANLDTLRGDADSVRRFATTLRETTENVEDALEVPRRAQQRASQLERLIDTAEDIALSLGKVPIAIIAQPSRFLARVLDRIGDSIERVEEKADDIADDIARRGWNDAAEDARIRAEQYEDRAMSVVATIGGHLVAVQQADAALDQIAPLGPPAQQARAAADRSVVPPNSAVEEINASFRGTNERLTEFSDTVDPVNALVSDVLNVDRDAQALDGLLSALRKPLDIIDAVLRPIRWALDAVGFIYDTVVAPVIDPVIEALGINRLFDSIAERMERLLPDVTILDDFLDRLTEAVRGFFDDAAGAAAALYKQIEAPLADFIEGIEQRFISPTQTAPPNSGGARFGGPDADTLVGRGGPDYLAGGDGDDRISGLAGNDVLIGGGGDDLIAGGPGEDTVVHRGGFGQYVVEQRDEDLDGDGQISAGEREILFVANVRPRVPSEDDGRDTLFGIETLRFDGLTIARSELDSVIRTPDDSLTRHFAVGTPERDFIIGGRGSDVLRGEGGDDYLYGGDPGPRSASGASNELYGGAGNDILDVGVRELTREDVIDGGPGRDVAIFRDAVLSGAKFTVVFALDPAVALPFAPFQVDVRGIEEAVGSSGDDQIWGSGRADVIDGDGGDDVLRGLAGGDIIRGGGGRDVLAGDQGNDTLDGGASDDFFVGGFGSDVIDGGEGDGDLVWYASPALLTNGGVSDTQTVQRLSRRLVDVGDDRAQGEDVRYGEFGPAAIFARVEIDLQAGAVAKFVRSNGGLAPAGRDRVENVERAHGSDGDDLILGGAGRELLEGGGGNDVLNGRDGDDEVYGETGNDRLTVYADGIFEGGDGDDLFNLLDAEEPQGVPDRFDRARVDGGSGEDVLNLTGSGSAWEVRLDFQANGFSRGAGGSYRDAFAANRIAIAFDPDAVDLTEDRWTAVPERGQARQAMDVERIERVLGSAFDDLMEADRNLSATLEGRGGADRLIARSDADRGVLHRLIGGDGDDLLEGLGVEDHLFGGDGDDVFRPEGGSNARTSGDGDTMIGAGGDDVFHASAAIQLIDGGEGVDTVFFNEGNGSNPVFIDLGGDPADWFGPAFGDRITGVENVYGTDISNRGDRISGDEAANLLAGMAGADTLDGEGGDDALYGGDGFDELFGGDGDDLLHGGSGNNRLVGGADVDTASWAWLQAHVNESARSGAGVRGTVDADLETGEADHGNGLDTLEEIENLTGGGADDALRGDAFANVLIGGDGDDLLEGRGGDDTLIGGEGADTMLGGEGDDVFVAADDADIIIGGPGMDTIDYAAAAAGVTFDVRSNRASKTVLLQQAVWNDVDDATSAAATAERTDPRNGNRYTPRDVLNADELRKSDPDAASVPLPESRVIETMNASGETMTAADFSIRLAMVRSTATDQASGIENVVGGAGADRLVGDAGDNHLVGRAGGDVLSGGDGDDVLEGGEGRDALYGGAGRDTADYSGEEGGVGARLDGGANFGRAAGDSIGGVENLRGSRFADTLIGDRLANVLMGGAASDRLFGQAGGDILRGEDGGDLLEGGAGSDLLDGGAGFDRASYAAEARGVGARLDGGPNFGAAAGDVYRNVEGLIGSRFADTLVGSAGVNLLDGGAGADRLFGLGGDDLLIGGGGPDRLDGGAGRDTADYSAENAAVLARLDGQANGGAATGDVYASIESLTGSRFADTLVGDGRANVLDGGAGDDRLFGGGGSDFLIGGPGADAFDGGGGSDTVSYADADSRAGARLDGGASFGAAAGDRFVRVENLVGSRFDDVLAGDGGANILRGGAGGDALFGLGGGDRLLGEDGSDRLSPGDGGSDLVDGGAGFDRAVYADATGAVGARLDGGPNFGRAAGDVIRDVEGLVGSRFGDTLIGSGAANTLEGGAGPDALFGLAGTDLFVFSGPGFGSDAIRDWEDGVDRIDFRGYAGLSLADVRIGGGGTTTRIDVGDDSIFVVNAPPGTIDGGDVLFA